MKSSILNEKNTKYLIFKSEESDLPDNTTRGMLLNNSIDGVLPFTFSGFDNVQTVRYDISGLKTVSEYLKNEPDCDSVLRIIKAAAMCCKEADEYLIERSSVVFCADKVFMSDDEQKIFFLILPFVNSTSPDIKEFIKTLLFNISFRENENCTYIGKIINYLNKNSFEPEKFTALCDTLSVPEVFSDSTSQTDNENSRTVYAPENHRNDFPVFHPKTEQSNGKKPVSSVSDKSRKNENFYGFKIPLDKYADEEPEVKEKRGLFSKIFERTRPAFEKLKCDEFGEIINEYDSCEHIPFLLRVKNNEKITINNSFFRIGTDYNMVDYCIYDNTAVSRIHASIKSKCKNYYITDENSTNHTFLNEKRIKNGISEKIENKSKIRLGNEEFIFYCS